MEQTPADATASPADDVRPDVPQDHGTRFYDRIRASIHAYVDKRGGALEKTADFLLLVPDVFILLWRLVNDPRVLGKDKVLLGSAIAYFVFPFDFMPEGLIGAMGYLDDLVLAAYVLNRFVASDHAIVREHWSGSEDVLAMIRRVLGAADSLIGSKVVGKVKKMAERD